MRKAYLMSLHATCNQLMVTAGFVSVHQLATNAQYLSVCHSHFSAFELPTSFSRLNAVLYSHLMGTADFESGHQLCAHIVAVS